MNFSNGLFVSETKEQLYLHSEVPCWMGLTKKGKVAIMIEVDTGLEFNNKFAEKCKKHSIELPEENLEELISGVTLTISSPEPRKPNEKLEREEATAFSDTESVAETDVMSVKSKASDKKRIVKLQHLKKVSHDTKLLLVKDFLHSKMAPLEYLQKVAVKTRNLEGFNFLVGDMTHGFYFYSNKDKDRCVYEVVQGEYAIGRIPGLETATECIKVLDRAKQQFTKICAGLASHDLEEVPSDPLFLSEWVDKKRELIAQRREHIMSPQIMDSLFSILQSEEVFPEDPVEEFREYFTNLQ